MSRHVNQSGDREAGVDAPLRRRTFTELFFRTSIFEIIAHGICGRSELFAQVEGLPSAGRDLILRVVRRARLWKGERIDVAAELASHWREGLAKGASENELVRGFGDERRTARLIRRGMRRKRPLAWKLWFYWSRGLVTLVLSLVAVYLFLYGRALVDTPSIKRNYVAEWNAPTLKIPDADRAAPLYARANAAIVNAPGVREGVRFMVERDASEHGYRVSKAFLEANPQLVPLIREASRKPRMGIVISDADPSPEWNMAASDGKGVQLRAASENPLLISVLLPHLGAMRQMARFVVQDAAIALQAGDAERVLDDWTILPRMARHAAEDGTLIGQLVGVAFLDMMFKDVLRVMQSRPDFFDASQLRRLAHEVAASGLRERAGDFKLSFARESLSLDDVVQRAFTDDGNGDGRLAPRGLAELGEYFMPDWASGTQNSAKSVRGALTVGPVAPLAVVWSAGRRETVDAYRELVGAYEAQRAIPLWDRATPSPLSAATHRYDLGIARSRFFVLQALWPSFARMIAAEREIVQSRDVALTSIGLAAYRVSGGAWPRTLEELVPSFMPSVPIDGFDGKPLKYRVTADGPLLYSIGLDFEDNQGKIAPTEQAAIDMGRMSPGLSVAPGAARCDVVYWPRPVYTKASAPAGE